MMRRVGLVSTFAIVASVLASGHSPAESRSTPDGRDGRWVAGDLHIHTTYSHDSYGGPADDNTGPDEAYTLGHSVASQFAVAKSRGLDYLAITDHNDIRSQSDPGFGTTGVIPIPGYEKSLKGHAQMLGATRIYDTDLVKTAPDGSVDPSQSTADVNALAEELRRDGGVFQANHPAEGSVDPPHDLDWSYGYSVVPDTVEVWNIARLWQPPMPSASSNDDAIRYWEGFLDRGHRVGATGGSDNHYLATTPIQGAGQPTTWVYVTDDGEEGVLEGLRAGRTFISHQPPAYGGPQLFLEGDGDSNGTFESIVGDDVPPGSLLRIRVEGAPGSLMRVIVDRGTQAFAPVPVTSPSFEHRFTVPAGSTWVRAEILEPDGDAEREQTCDRIIGGESTYCRNKLLVLAMTSALYLRADPKPSTSPSQSGAPSPTADPQPQGTSLTFTDRSAQTGQYSDEVVFEARLTTDGGEPLQGREISFEQVGSETRSFTAVTDADGVATKPFVLDAPPGQYQLFARFGGDPGRYDSSAAMTGFVLDKEDTELSFTASGKGAKRSLTAALSDRDAATGIGGRAIEFFADGDTICSAITDREGRASCDPPARYQGGPHEYTAVFRGDDYYRPSEDSA